MNHQSFMLLVVAVRETNQQELVLVDASVYNFKVFVALEVVTSFLPLRFDLWKVVFLSYFP